jgi:hypothetical protein
MPTCCDLGRRMLLEDTGPCSLPYEVPLGWADDHAGQSGQPA